MEAGIGEWEMFEGQIDLHATQMNSANEHCVLAELICVDWKTFDFEIPLREYHGIRFICITNLSGSCATFPAVEASSTAE